MLRHVAIWRNLNKKTCLVSGVLALLVVFYVMFSVNYCVITNIHKFLDQGDEVSESSNRPSVAVSRPHSVVRLVPLVSWAGLEDDLHIAERNRSVDGAPKYRFLRQQSLRAMRRMPQALVIGVKKSGTRALLEFIRLHPDVRAAGSEVHFFDRHYHRGFNWYRDLTISPLWLRCLLANVRRHMPATLEGQVTMEKTPSYFVTREAPARVRQMDPATKLLVVVRDPVTRAISDYTQAISKKTEVVVKKFEELAFVNGSVSGSVDTAWGPVRIGVYARYLERWRHYFPLSQMLFVSGERLIVDPAAEMARVQDFLGLKQVVTEKHFYFNATKGFPCLMKSEGRATPHCLGKTKGRNHPHIRASALARLRDFYRPFNLRFYQLTGINFGWP